MKYVRRSYRIGRQAAKLVELVSCYITITEYAQTTKSTLKSQSRLQTLCKLRHWQYTQRDNFGITAAGHGASFATGAIFLAVSVRSKSSPGRCSGSEWDPSS